MKEQNYNLNNLGNTFYLFKRDDEKMIDDIKKFALRYRNKICLLYTSPSPRD